MNDYEVDVFINQREKDYYPSNLIRIISKEYYLQGLTHSNKPLFFTWNITNECNQKCKYCSLSDDQRNSKSKTNVSDITEQLLVIKPLYVSILGGEPTLVRELPDVIKRLTDKGIFVEIVSNGFGIDDEFLHSIKNVNTNLLRVEISLDSHIRENNDNNRGIGSYDRAMCALIRIKNSNIHTRVQMTVCSSNQYDIIGLYKKCCDMKVESFGFSTVVQFGKGVKEKLDYTKIYSQCSEIIENEGCTRFEKIRTGSNIKKTSSNFKCTESESLLNEFIKCNGSKTKAHIEPNGSIYPCDFLIYPEFYMGKIWDNYWNSDTALQFRTLNRNKKIGCSTCNNIACNTGCYAISYVNFLKTNVMKPNCEIDDI